MKNKIKIIALAAVMTAPIMFSGTASAQTVYTDRASFLAAVTNPMTTTFNDVTSDIVVGSGNTVEGFSFTGATGSNSTIDAAPFNSNSLNGVNGSTFFNLSGLGRGATFNIGLASAVSAFGFDTFNFDVGNDRTEVFIGSTSLGLTPATRGATGFLGFVASPGSTFSTVSIVGRGAGDAFNGFDNFTTATGAVPEPATWAMMLAGVGLMGFAMRRRSKNVTTTVAYAA